MRIATVGVTDEGYGSSSKPRLTRLQRSSSISHGSRSDPSIANNQFDRMTNTMDEVAAESLDAHGSVTSGSSSGASLGIRKIKIQSQPRSSEDRHERKRKQEDRGRQELEQWDTEHTRDGKRLRSESGGIGGSVGSIGRRFELLKVAQADHGGLCRRESSRAEEDDDEGESGTFLKLETEVYPSGKTRTVARDSRLSLGRSSSMGNRLTITPNPDSTLRTPTPTWLLRHLAPQPSPAPRLPHSTVQSTYQASYPLNPPSTPIDTHPIALQLPFSTDGRVSSSLRSNQFDNHSRTGYDISMPIYDNQMEQYAWTNEDMIRSYHDHHPTSTEDTAGEYDELYPHHLDPTAQSFESLFARNPHDYDYDYEQHQQQQREYSSPQVDATSDPSFDVQFKSPGALPYDDALSSFPPRSNSYQYQYQGKYDEMIGDARVDLLDFWKRDAATMELQPDQMLRPKACRDPYTVRLLRHAQPISQVEFAALTPEPIDHSASFNHLLRTPTAPARAASSPLMSARQGETMGSRERKAMERMMSPSPPQMMITGENVGSKIAYFIDEENRDAHELEEDASVDEERENSKPTFVKHPVSLSFGFSDDDGDMDRIKSESMKDGDQLECMDHWSDPSEFKIYNDPTPDFDL